ncbi:type II secretion system F family protein [Oceanivirga salmonicida]|uniref:type II secretion system F family protein n=1 Tax=Oceanivirga salmonicida TaxID=1769291 RepID=UPI0008307F37|nr:type II secretion system F family protein [Oceanivirga salmonicida]
MSDFKLRKEFVTKLYDLVSADIELIEALEILKNIDKKKIYIAKKSLEKGDGIVNSFRNISKDEQFLNFFRFADNTGNVASSLKLLKDEYEFIDNLKSQILGIIIYPILVLVTTLIITIVLLVVVVPKFSEIYANTGVELPYITRLILNMSDFIKNNFFIIIISIISTICIVFLIIKNNKKQFHKYILKINLVRDINILKFSKNIHLLLEANLDFSDALRMNNCTNIYFKECIKRIIKKIEKGENIVIAFEKEFFFPVDIINYIKISEKTGNLSKSFKNISTIYEQNIKNKINISRV